MKNVHSDEGKTVIASHVQTTVLMLPAFTGNLSMLKSLIYSISRRFRNRTNWENGLNYSLVKYCHVLFSFQFCNVLIVLSPPPTEECSKLT